MKRSFGPAKPAVLLLTLGRAAFALVPFSVVFFALIQLAGTILVVFGFWIEPFRLQIVHQQLQSSILTPGTRLSILHLGDLHIERLTHREESILKAINELKPDLILFSGDILNLSYLHDPLAWLDARAFFHRLSAPLGVFIVTGSPAVDLAEIIPDLINDLPIRHLQDEAISLPINNDFITIIGTSCSHRPHNDGPVLQSILQKNNLPSTYTILLHHSPDLAPIAANLGIDLQLSGHTHGGQVCLPFYGALVTASLYGKQFESGKYQIGDLVLYITRGIGMEGAGAPRVRFLCPPEITFWEISSTS